MEKTKNSTNTKTEQAVVLLYLSVVLGESCKANSANQRDDGGLLLQAGLHRLESPAAGK